MAPANRANKKVANSLVAVSSAAVLAVYAAGYVRTRSAADRFDLQAADRRPAFASTTSQSATAGRPVASAFAAPKSVAASADKPVASTSAAPTPVATSADKPAASASAAPEPVAAMADKPAAPVAIATPDAPAKSGYKDGTYLGWGHCRHGDIQASVVIVGGRIESAKISDCQTRYPCSIIAALPPQVSQRQTPDVDTISGATQSGDAFYYAVLDALYQAK